MYHIVILWYRAWNIILVYLHNTAIIWIIKISCIIYNLHNSFDYNMIEVLYSLCIHGKDTACISPFVISCDYNIVYGVLVVYIHKREINSSILVFILQENKHLTNESYFKLKTKNVGNILQEKHFHRKLCADMKIQILSKLIWNWDCEYTTHSISEWVGSSSRYSVAIDYQGAAYGWHDAYVR